MAKPKPEDTECPICEGTGNNEPNCGFCEGAGFITDPHDGETVCCPECGADICEECNGTGTV